MEIPDMPGEDHSRVSFDANDDDERVKRTGLPFLLQSHEQGERGAIHLALRNTIAVRSESAGIGPGRMVAIV